MLTVFNLFNANGVLQTSNKARDIVGDYVNEAWPQVDDDQLNGTWEESEEKTKFVPFHGDNKSVASRMTKVNVRTVVMLGKKPGGEKVYLAQVILNGVAQDLVEVKSDRQGEHPSLKNVKDALLTFKDVSSEFQELRKEIKKEEKKQKK